MSEELCATDGCGKPAVGRYEAGGVGSAHCQSCLNAIAGTKYGIDYEQEYHEERKARYAAQSELVASQARLSEAVKVLEEMVKWLNYLPAPYPDDSQMIRALTAKAKAFLATLGEENEA